MQNQNDTGTILYLQDNGKDLIFPFTKIGEAFRGGMFWCIPNQGPPRDIFEMQNGEYRKSSGTSIKTLEGKWGKIEAVVSWNFEKNKITTKASMHAFTDSILRPGFHPYFPVSESFTISIGNRTLSKEEIKEGEILYIAVQGPPVATLTSGNGATTISFSTNLDGASLSFCIWTDNKERYVCIEPVIGSGFAEDNSPLPFPIAEGDRAEIEAVLAFS